MGRPTGRDFSFIEILAVKDIFQVPEYQRDYNWKPKTFDKLVDDLMEHALDVENQQNEPYFLGNVIIHNTEDEWFLVDGQQRTTALSLLSCAIRDKMVENEEFELAERVHNNIIVRANGSFRYSPKSESDTQKFLGYYQSFPDIRYDIVFEQEIEEDGMHVGRVQRFTPNRTIHQNSQHTIPDIATVTAVGYIGCRSRTEIAIEVSLEENSIIEVGQVMTINSPDRTLYNENRGPMNFGRKIAYHYKRGYTAIQKRLESYIGDEEGNAGQFFTKLNNMLTYVSFTTTEFDSIDEAIYYFEVLNDDSNRLSLSAGDLLRARIETLRRNDRFTQEHRALWKTKLDIIQSNLIKSGSYDYVSEFMWTWLLSRGKRVSKRKTWSFFQELLNQEQNGEDITALMNTLARESKLFREIHSPKQTDPEFGGLSALSGVVKQHHPLLLNVYAAYKNFENEADNGYKPPLRRITRIFSHLILKGFILPELEEKIASNILYSEVEKQCKDIWNWPDNVEDWTAHVNAGHPNQDRIVQFLTSFSNRVSEMVGHKPLIGEDGRPVERFYQEGWTQVNSKLVLSYIEWYIRGFHEDPTWTDGIEVEHILPQKPAKYGEDEEGDGFKYWGQFSTEQHALNVNYLGNRLLLPEGANKKLQNYSFITKKEMPQDGYDARSASWKLVNLVREYGNWTVDEINLLGKLYSELAVHIFGNETFMEDEFIIPPFNDSIAAFQEHVEMDIPNIPLEEE